MISIVICSVKPNLLAALRENISATIGVEYEIIAIDNRNTEHGLCHVYNHAAAKAQYDILCFMHEDIEILTTEWGAKVLAHFSKQAELGLLGVAGSRYKCKFPSGWSTGSKQTDCQHLFHRDANGALKEFSNPPSSEDAAKGYSKVRVLDGLWLCVRRTLWSQLGFDEAIPGFHFYDLDFSLRCQQRMEVAVIYDVELAHFSMGHFDSAWLVAAIAYHRKQKEIASPLMSKEEIDQQKLERKFLRFWIKTLRSQRLPRGLLLTWLQNTPIWRYPQLWLSALKLLLHL